MSLHQREKKLNGGSIINEDTCVKKITPQGHLQSHLLSKQLEWNSK